MKDYFIQFYDIDKTNGINLMNGFSNTYNFCKSKGKLIWLNDDIDELPIKEGNAYVSAFYSYQLHKVYLWAKRYPNINFLVGGPVCSTYFEVKEHLPSNFFMTDKTVEEFFGISDKKWMLEIPEEAINDFSKDLKTPISFTYSIDNLNKCYWNKCIFCSYTTPDKCFSYPLPNSKDIKFEYQNVKYDGPKLVHFGTSALSPKLIKIIEDIPGGFWTEIYIRATESEYKELKKIKRIRKNINFIIGMEFPTQKMWNYMKKGYNTNTVLKILDKLKGLTSLTTIVGWNNLTDNDLIELESFMKKIPETSKLIPRFLFIYNLFAFTGTKIHDMYKVRRKIFCGPFYHGFWPEISKKQIELNSKAVDILSYYGMKKGYRVVFDPVTIQPEKRKYE